MILTRLLFSLLRLFISLIFVFDMHFLTPLINGNRRGYSTDTPCHASEPVISAHNTDTPLCIARMPLSCMGTGGGIPAPSQILLQNTTG
jgi:hypothetical protein